MSRSAFTMSTLPALTIPNRDYWNGVLYMLALLHVSGNFHLWY